MTSSDMKSSPAEFRSSLRFAQTLSQPAEALNLKQSGCLLAIVSLRAADGPSSSCRPPRREAAFL